MSKTSRGFELQHFVDDYGAEYSLQESSNVEPHIWLGIDKPEILIMWKDAKLHGLDLEKKYPGTNEYGWCDYPIPSEALIESRMHLNPQQARDLAMRLLYFAEHGYLETEAGGDTT